MNESLLQTSVVQLLGSLILGFLALFFVARLLTGKFGKHYVNEEEPLSNILFLSSGLFATGFLLSVCVQPVINVTRILRGQQLAGTDLYIGAARFTGLFIFIALATFFLVMVLSAALHRVIYSRIQLKPELQDSLVPRIMLPVLIIVFSLLAKDCMLLIIESFIPYPSIPNFH